MNKLHIQKHLFVSQVFLCPSTDLLLAFQSSENQYNDAKNPLTSAVGNDWRRVGRIKKNLFSHSYVPGFELRSAWCEASVSTQKQSTGFKKILCGKKFVIISELTASFWNGWQAELI